MNVSPLSVAHPQSPELVQPNKGPFDHPAPSPRPAAMFGVALRKKRDDAVTVGTAIASCPPYRSVRAELPHTAPTLDEWRQSAPPGKDARCEDGESTDRRSGVCAAS